MNETLSRVLLYGGALLAVSGIGAWWLATDREADVDTLISSATVQLQMAYVIPATDQQGNRLDKRDDMIEAAVAQLDIVDRKHPNMATAVELRGFAHMLNGRFVDAAGCYERARQCGDCGAEQRDVLTFNQARMLARGGDQEGALRVFTEHAQELDDRFGHQRRLEMAMILIDLGRHDEADACLQTVVADDAAPPMARLQAGIAFDRMGRDQAAERAFSAVREQEPIADYYLARLKLRQGDVDTSLELLGGVHAAMPAEVRRRLQTEADAWSAVADDARFRELTVGRPASPGR